VLGAGRPQLACTPGSEHTELGAHGVPERQAGLA